MLVSLGDATVGSLTHEIG